MAHCVARVVIMPVIHTPDLRPRRQSARPQFESNIEINEYLKQDVCYEQDEVCWDFSRLAGVYC